MKVDVLDQKNGITTIVMSGRMDIEGAPAADMKFSVVAGSKKHVVVDLSDVSFMASLGMRTLIVSVKTIASKGGSMALLNPQANVEKALKASGVDTVIPIVRDMAAAEQIFKG